MDTLPAVGWALSGLGAFPLLASSTMKLIHHPVVVKNLSSFGFKTESLRSLGVAEMTIAILTLVPATSLFGVILATGWMGGAIATHLRVGDKFVIQTIVPILIWVGFALGHQALFEQAFGM